MDFKLDPPRTKSRKQADLVLISSVLQTTTAAQPVSFMVDSVQLWRQEEVERVKSCMLRMFNLTTLAGHMAPRKRTAPASFTKEESPAKGARCRTLGQYPTGTEMLEFVAQR